nr:hypothetical protein BgiMline_033277 [Biomphalaria glabrata]
MSVLVITLIVFISTVSANPKGQLCDIYTKNVTEIVTKCLVNDSSNLLQALSNKESQIDVICNMIKAQEECYDLFHGSCSRQLVDLAKEAYRKLFQVERCDPNHYISTENSNEAMKHLLRSILLPGRTYSRKYQKDELLFTLNTTPSRTEPNSEIKATEETY